MGNRDSKSDRKCGQKDVPVSTTKITDINDDCLEHIFKMLNPGDLLNVKDSSKRFSQATDFKYSSTYGDKKISIVGMKPSPHRIISIYDDIHIYDLATILKMLRCFGHLIKNALINHMNVDRNHQNEVHLYLSKYCTDSLETIFVEFASQLTMENIEKPFSKLHTIEFLLSDLRSMCIEKHFPHLQHLAIEIHLCKEKKL